MTNKTNYQKVVEFNSILGLGVEKHPVVPTESRITLRKALIDEEAVKELNEGFAESDLEKIADAIGDSLVVVYGAATDCGLDADIIFAEIHRSNMSKLCNSEADAILAVKRYAAGDGYHGKYEPIIADYRACAYPGYEDKFIVFNKATGKTLKSPTFFEPCLKPLLAQMEA